MSNGATKQRNERESCVRKLQNFTPLFASYDPKSKKKKKRRSNACAFISVNSLRCRLGAIREERLGEGGGKVVTFRIDKSCEKR